MKLDTFYQSDSDGWSIDAFPPTNSENTLVIVFGDSSLLDDQATLQPLLDHYSNSIVIGCSTSGEIFATDIHDHSLSVATMAFEHTAIKRVLVDITSVGNSKQAGEQIAQQLNAEDLRAVFILSDGLNVNGSDLVKGVSSNLPEHVPVTGGLAGDGDRFQRTWVLNGDKVTQNCISAVGFYGDRIRFGHGSKGGWDMFGPQRLVTRSEGNVLFELDGKPALDLYKEYLGELATGLPATGLLYPLAIVSDSDADDVVRTILAVDENEKSLTFAGDIPQGEDVQLMHANFDRLIDGASGAAESIQLNESDKDNTLAIAISCVGRRLVLKDQTEEEIEATASVLPSGTRQIGFYSYGELSPLASGTCDLHNQTMTLTLISEV